MGKKNFFLNSKEIWRETKIARGLERKKVLENIVGLLVVRFCGIWKLSTLHNCAHILRSERTKIPVTNLPFATIARKGSLDHFEIFLQKNTLDLMTAHWVMEGISLIWGKKCFLMTSFIHF